MFETDPLHIGLSSTDRTLPLMLGEVSTPGLNLNVQWGSSGDIFRRALIEQEFDVTEMSLAAFSIMVARDESPFIGLPVVLSRMFRHGCIFVRSDNVIQRLEDLEGTRIGVPEIQMTAVVWLRGILQNHHGVDIEQVDWVRGGVNRAGPIQEKIKFTPSERFSVTDLPEKSLNQALLDDDIDAIISPHRPKGLRDKSLRVLLKDTRQAELHYFSTSGIFPSMHLLVMRKEAYHRNILSLKDLYHCFLESKNISIKRLSSLDALPVMVPWLVQEMERTRELMGVDYWPYGFTLIRDELQVFLAYLDQQALLKRALKPEDLIAPELIDT